jgi:NAD(P)-dependent dehydrogenase (short-subunit alcohol dehydrogenase family)
MDCTLNNKVIIVTGGAKVIGEAILRVLAAVRATPFIIGRSKGDSESFVIELQWNRMTPPEKIANTVAFLLSEKSSHTTGPLIHVDGGYEDQDRAIISNCIQP